MNIKEKEKETQIHQESRREKRQSNALEVLKSTEILKGITRVRRHGRFIFLSKWTVI